MTLRGLLNCMGAAAAALALIGPVYAQRSWDGGNATFVWGDNGNWSPDGSPQSEAISIGNLVAAANDTTLLDDDYSIDSLAISNGADVENSTDNGVTTEFELLVNGPTTISDAGSSIVVFGGGPDGEGLDTDTLTINTGGTLTINSQTTAGTAIVAVDNGVMNINGGTVSGNGVLRLDDNPAAATALLINDGTISVGNLGIAIGAPPRTLQITAINANARVDFDGIIGTGIVNVNRSATLDVDVTIGDAFGGDLNLFAGSTLDVADPWEINFGTVDVNTPGILVGTGGPTAHIAGAAVTFSGGTLTLGDGLDLLTLDAALTSTSGIINNSGTITVNSVSTIGAGTDFNMIGSDSKLTINGTLNVDTPDFNLDGGGAAGNLTTINAGGILDLDLGAGADLGFDHTINMNGGELDVTTSAATAWTLNFGATIIAAGAATSTINSAGETFNINGNVHVDDDSTLVVNSVSNFANSAAVVIDAGGTLNMGTATYNGGSFTGDGVLRKGSATIAAATTWNVDTVDLDDGNTTLNANLTINADRVEIDADGVDGTHTINDGTLLTINVTPGAWRFDSTGVIVYNGNASTETYLAGSDVSVNGTINHTGDGRIDARLDVGSTGVVNILTAGEPLRLSGGNNMNDPNRIVGGTINGPGILGADGGTALHGCGTIGADVDFDGTANLKADNGILSLTVGTAIIDVNEIGTADVDGILSVGSPWNTNVAASVVLNGGEVTGAAITNEGASGINGHGLVSARVLNDTRIDAEGGGMLIVETAADNNDWDGAGNAGSLNALSGNLEIRDDAAVLFNGSVQVNSAFQVFANGFELEFEPASTLTLNGGSFRSTNATDLGGTVTVGAGVSDLGIAGTTIFEATSSTTIAGTLRLNNPATQINSGATFAGGGTLLNSAGNTLRLQDGADVDVLVENQGTLVIGNTVAQATGLDFQQDAGALWNVDLGGLGLAQFDRYTLTGVASLAGTLDIDLTGGYVPTVGDTLTILSAVGGVTGHFASVVEPAGMPAGLLFDVVYQPTLVQLVAVNAPIYSADFDLDGDVDGDDLAVWTASFGVNDGADADSDGDSDGADFLAWQQQLGSVPAVAAAGSVPEPASIALLATTLLFGSSNRSRRRRRVG